MEEITDSTLSNANIAVRHSANLSGTKIHDTRIAILPYGWFVDLYLNLNGAEIKNSKFYFHQSDQRVIDVSDYVGEIYRIQNFPNASAVPGWPPQQLLPLARAREFGL